ncbi:hypothetical protein [Aquibacillus halophilus]|uniref:hypothetical protein n=1 Tax=Aquibacillus halophilus TaxID=930132 RepID=UPI0014793206|nr:hypothetical protein [Aquibacillus halophilus]
MITTLYNGDWSGGQSTPAGKATAENPTGSGFLPRKLKRCPRKATVRSANQLIATLRRFLFISSVKILKQ